MPDDKPLSDNQTHDLLTEMSRMAEGARGETTRSDSALEAARRYLKGLAAALLYGATMEEIDPKDRKQP